MIREQLTIRLVRSSRKTTSYARSSNTSQLPTDETRARKIALQAPMFAMIDGILMFVDSKRKDQKRAVVPSQLQHQVMEENHRGHVGAHFSGQKLFRALSRHWWWEGMLADMLHYAKNCPECAIVTGGGQTGRPSLHSIPVQRPFQIVGVDIMELPLSRKSLHSGFSGSFDQVAHGFPHAGSEVKTNCHPASQRGRTLL